MKKITLLSLFLPLLFQSAGFTQIPYGTSPLGNKSWTVSKPFQRDVFIENNGQFSDDEKKAVGAKILYYTHKGSDYLYFTSTGLIMRYDSAYKIEGEKNNEGDRDGLGNMRVKHLFTKMQFAGCNSTANMVVENETPDYFTFPNHADKTGKTGIIAHGWTKLTYKNIYNGIDIEFYYPEDKGGIEYNIIVHPGANPSVVKMLYSNSNVAISGNDIKINMGWDAITDHAPTAKDGSGNPVAAAFKLTGKTISFDIGSYDKTQTLVIDPWMTLTTLGGVNLAYDLGYDYFGNVYVYGGGISNYYELQKYNNGGALQWTFVNNTFTYLYITGYFYGGLTTDHITGTSYMCEGFAPPTNHVVKVNTNGTQGALFSGPGGTDEEWRIGYDYCNNQLVLCTGGSTIPDAATLDTNCTTMQIINIGSTSDESMLAFDNIGNCYLGNCRMVFGGGKNMVFKLPLPGLVPVTYSFWDKHDIEEITNLSYYPILSGYDVGNGFNGLAATPTLVYTYDGAKLRQWKASNGNIVDSATVSGTALAWGGLDVDCQGHVYAGNNQSVSIYDSNMVSLGNVALNNTVYDVLVAPNGNIYACGNGYVQCVAGSTKMVTITSTPAGCACTGSATANTCGKGPFTYKWSNGATTSTISGMCSGTYTCTVWEGNCPKPFDTAIVNLGAGGGFAATVTTVNPTCATSGSAIANPTGGHPPYTYFWSNGKTTTNDTGLSAGTYYVLITDSTGCKDSLSFTLTSSGVPTVLVTPNIDTICNGASSTLTASGAQTYTWLPTTGLSCNNCANPSASPTITTTYTVTGDSAGCKATATATVTVLAPPVIKATATPDTVCLGQKTNLLATGAVSYTWAPSTGLSCTACPNPTATPTAAITYTVIGTDAHGCTNAATVTINVAAPPNLTVSSNKSICPGQSATLHASGTGTGFNWQPGNSTNPTITVSPTVTTTYTVTLSNGCVTATASVTVFVNPVPVPKFTADVMQGCSPLCVQFRNRSTITSGSIQSFSWLFGNGDSSNSRNPVYCYPDPGVYTVDMTVVSDSGCSSTLKVLDLITVYSHPIANFTATPQPATMLNPTIQFTDKSTDTYGITYWNWNFGDGIDSVAYTQNANHTYGDSGTYCVKLNIINMHGCTDTITNCLVIGPIYCLYIPNAFSPNGDGKNEIFTAKGNDIVNFEMYIFDRWGMQLFHSTDINNGWDGRVKGGNVICQEDTYVYLINVTDSKKVKHSYTGVVNLIK